MKGYRKYLSKKLFWYLGTLVVAIALNFILPRLIPGNPIASVTSKLAEGMSDADTMKRIYDNFNQQFALDKSMFEQFIIYIQNLLQGDMGVSFSQYPRPVSEIISTSVGWTLALQIPAILVSWILGNILGAIAAYRKGVYDKVIFPIFLFLNAIPAFAFAILMVYIFANKLEWLPASGGYEFSMIMHMSPEFILSALSHYILPFLSIVLVAIGGQSLGMREMSLYELDSDYIKYSRLMGIKDSQIVRYVFRNAMLPQVTGLALSLGTIMGGSLITEIIFSYPGLGNTMFTAIRTQDFPLISGCTLIITIMVLIANFAVDIIYGFIDPRIKAVQQED